MGISPCLTATTRHSHAFKTEDEDESVLKSVLSTPLNPQTTGDRLVDLSQTESFPLEGVDYLAARRLC